MSHLLSPVHNIQKRERNLRKHQLLQTYLPLQLPQGQGILQDHLREGHPNEKKTSIKSECIAYMKFR